VVQGDINATLVGTCTTCHDAFNAGDHSVALPLDLGLTTAAQNGDNALPLFTVRNRTTGEQVQTTDLGRAMVTGLWKNVATFKGPILRTLSSRPPYFHNGSARTLADVVRFYDTRFHIGLQAQELADLQAFLEAL
jgi:cytochrome c peroxidase